MPRFSANISTLFKELPFLDRIDAAADAGFAAIECQFPYEFRAEDVAARIARRRLAFAMFNAPAGSAGEFGFAALAQHRDEMRRSVQTAVDYALATGVRKIHVLAGRADPTDAQARSGYVSSLQWAGEQAAVHGIEILIEPLNARDVQGYFLRSFDIAESIIAELPLLRLQFDVYHRQILHGDVTLAIRRLLPITGHIQIAGVPGRHEPGSGELDDFRFFAEIDRLGYAGFVGCEYNPETSTLDGLDWMKRVISQG
jgi:2-dehydrotetronate isomerase